MIVFRILFRTSSQHDQYFCQSSIQGISKDMEIMLEVCMLCRIMTTFSPTLFVLSALVLRTHAGFKRNR